jgi:hypothetical protein
MTEGNIYDVVAARGRLSRCHLLALRYPATAEPEKHEDRDVKPSCHRQILFFGEEVFREETLVALYPFAGRAANHIVKGGFLRHPLPSIRRTFAVP